MTPYISIKSVLYDISTNIEDQYWNETHALHWATKAMRKFITPKKYEQALGVFYLEDHKVTLPKELRHIVQVAYWNDNDLTELDNIFKAMGLDQSEYLADSQLHVKAAESLFTQTNWTAMKRSSNTFHTSVGTDYSIYPNTTAMPRHEYSLDSNNCLTSTLKTGAVMVAYLRYVTDDEGYAMIPDEENLKEAIFHYVMYRHWLSRSALKEEGSREQRDFHLAMFETLKKKATGIANTPDTDEMENLKNQTLRLVPRTERWAQFFQNLGAPEISYLPHETH